MSWLSWSLPEVGQDADLTELLKGLHPQGTELVAGDARAGRGTEASSSDAR